MIRDLRSHRHYAGKTLADAAVQIRVAHLIAESIHDNADPEANETAAKRVQRLTLSVLPLEHVPFAFAHCTCSSL